MTCAKAAGTAATSAAVATNARRTARENNARLHSGNEFCSTGCDCRNIIRTLYCYGSLCVREANGSSGKRAYDTFLVCNGTGSARQELPEVVQAYSLFQCF